MNEHPRNNTPEHFIGFTVDDKMKEFIDKGRKRHASLKLFMHSIIKQAMIKEKLDEPRK